MGDKPISSFSVPDIEDVPEDIRARILAVQEKAGFVPNVFLVLARRPEEFRAFFAYHDALMEKDGNLTKAEREMIVVATSAANQCQYCVVAHGAILRVRAKNPLIADQVAVNYRKADITPRQPLKLVIPGDPREPVDTKDPNRELDVNDHIINFLNDHTIEEQVVVDHKEAVPELKYDQRGIAIPAPKNQKPRQVPITSWISSMPAACRPAIGSACRPRWWSSTWNGSNGPAPTARCG